MEWERISGAAAVSWAAALFLLSGCEPATVPRSTSGTNVDIHNESQSVLPELEFISHDGNPALVDVRIQLPDSAMSLLPQDEDDPRWEQLIVVRRVDPTANLEANTSSAGIAGGVKRVEGGIVFHPRFSLLVGEHYEAILDPSVIPGLLGSQTSDLGFTIRSQLEGHGTTPSLLITAEYFVEPPSDTPPPRVTEIYPTADELPANHLKFYVVFSEPMQQGNIWNHFQVIDDDGEVIPSPFRETELWSEDATRLTLWFHPGRQKEGVNLNVEIGAILEEGRNYELKILADWKSLRGVALAEPLSKKFRAIAKDRVQPALADWTLSIPQAGSTKPLIVDFTEPLDWALLNSRIWLESADGRRIPGKRSVGTEQRSWEFLPEQPWTEGEFRLAVGSVLEDLAGNSLARPFEVDVTAGKIEDVAEILFRSFAVEAAR